MATRNERDVETSREDRGGWQQAHGDFGRMQSREDMRDLRSRDWRHDDRFGARDDERRMNRDDDDDERGWFDRVRDTASRWFHGRDDDDDDRSRDDDRDRFRAGGDEGSYRSRDDMDRWERTTADRDRGRRNWQDDDNRRMQMDDDNRGRMRMDDDNRRRQFAGYGRDDDDRSGQFSRLRHDHGTLGRRGDVGLSGRTPYDRYDDRGRFSGFSGDEDRNRRMYGERNRNLPFGDERNERGRFDRDFDRTREDQDWQSRGFPRQTSGIGREWQTDDRDRQLGRERSYGRSDRSQYGGSQHGGHDDHRGYGRSSVRSFVGEDHRMTHDEHRQARDDNRPYGQQQQYGQGRSYGREDRGFGRSERSFGRDDRSGSYQYGGGRQQLDRDEYGRYESRRRR